VVNVPFRTVLKWHYKLYIKPVR